MMSSMMSSHMISSHPIRRIMLIMLATGLTLAACQKVEPDPTATPNQEAMQAASTLFAEPTRRPAVAATATSAGTVEIALSRSAARMEQAVLEGDIRTYLDYITQEDPVFRADHTAWAEDWAANPVSAFSIELFGITETSPTIATARMTIKWSRQETNTSGGATISVLFKEEGDRWVLAGEDWETFETEGIVFHYFADEIVNNTTQATTVSEFLPAIYTNITRVFDHFPTKTAHILMYDSAPTLATMTRISQPELALWNVPGESIKITLGPSKTAPREPTIAREFTRFVLYDLADGQREHFPRWVEDGLAAYGAAQFQTLSQRNRTLKSIAALINNNPTAIRQLLAWDALDDPASLSPEEQAQVIDQTFTLIHYITETHGDEARNAWITAIAGGASVREATQDALGISLDELDANWRDWLPTVL